jgi:hypothetical protein
MYSEEAGELPVMLVDNAETEANKATKSQLHSKPRKRDGICIFS